MDKITNYMRATKKRKAPEVDALKPLATKQQIVPAATHHEPTLSTVLKPKKHVGPTYDDDEVDESGNHVPTFIYATVKYKRRAEPRKVAKTTQRVVDYIQEHYVIPADFETSHLYGPHSGMSYDRRLLRAYKLKLLALKYSDREEPAVICISCASIGHSDRECPDGF